MLPKFLSKTEMEFYIPMERFNYWPEDTFSFCPKCGMDSFELLFKNKLEIYIQCRICNALWIIKPTGGPIHVDAAFA